MKIKSKKGSEIEVVVEGEIITCTYNAQGREVSCPHTLSQMPSRGYTANGTRPLEWFLLCAATGACISDADADAINALVDIARAPRLEAAAESAKHQARIYLSSRGWGDYSPAAWVGDIRRSDAEILAECREELERPDVDKQLSDVEILAAIASARAEIAAPRVELTVGTESTVCPYCGTHCYGDCGGGETEREREIRLAMAESAMDNGGGE